MTLSNLFKGAIYLSLAASIWGGMYVVSKFALDTIPPFTLLFLRYLTASLFLVFICWQRKELTLPRQNRGLLFQIGFIGYFLSIAAQFVGTKLSSAHMGAVITTLSPVFLSLFAVFLLKERMSFKQLMSMAVAFAGVMIVIGGGGGDSTLGGNISLLLAALFWGYYSVLSRKASADHSSLEITTWGILVATILTLPTIFFEWQAWSMKDLLQGPILLSVLYIGLVATALAFFSWNKGLSLLPSHQAGPFFFLKPVVGSLLGWLFLNEHLTPSFFLGSLFILAGVYFNMRQRD